MKNRNLAKKLISMAGALSIVSSMLVAPINASAAANIITNGDFEGTDVSHFASQQWGYYTQERVEGAGVDGSTALKFTPINNYSRFTTWGPKFKSELGFYKVSVDVKLDEAAWTAWADSSQTGYDSNVDDTSTITDTTKIKTYDTPSNYSIFWKSEGEDAGVVYSKDLTTSRDIGKQGECGYSSYWYDVASLADDATSTNGWVTLEDVMFLYGNTQRLGIGPNGQQYSTTMYMDNFSAVKLEHELEITAPESILVPKSGEAAAEANVTAAMRADLNSDGEKETVPTNLYKYALVAETDGVSINSSTGAITVDSTTEATSIDVTVKYGGTGSALLGTKTITLISQAVELPEASNVQVSGNPWVDEKLTIDSWDYKDKNNDEQQGTTFQWYRSDSEEGEGTAITGETAWEYTIKSEDVGKYIYAGVTPRNDKDETGAEAYSARIKAFASYTPEVSDRDLIIDGGSENGIIGWSVQGKSGYWDANDSMKQSDEYAKTGTYSLEYSENPKWDALFSVGKEIVLDSGKFYEASAWVKSDNKGSKGSKTGFFYGKTADANTENNYLSYYSLDFSALNKFRAAESGMSSGLYTLSDGTGVIGDWQEVKYVIYAKKNYTGQIGLGGAKGSTTYIDDFSVVEIAPTFEYAIPSEIAAGNEIDITTSVKFAGYGYAVPAENVTYAIADGINGVTLDGTTLTISEDTEPQVIDIAITYQGATDEDGVNTEAVTYTHKLAVTKADTDSVKSVAITDGDTVAGETLKAEAVVTGGTVAYQWYTSEAVDGEKTAIENANSAEYTVTENEAGKYIWVGAKVGDTAEAYAMAEGKAATEYVDLILVTGQSNSRIYEENGKNWFPEVTDPMLTIERDKVLRYSGQSLIDYNDVTCDDTAEGNDKNNLEGEGRVGIPYPIAKQWNERTGRKTILVSTGVGGSAVASHRYSAYAHSGVQVGKQTIDQYKACVAYLEENNMRIDKKLTFWLQGETNCYDMPEVYYREFMEMYNEYAADQYCGEQDLWGVIVPRAWYAAGGYGWNTDDELFVSGPRSMMYSLDGNGNDNIKLVSNVGDKLIGDEAVASYFNDSYKYKDVFDTIGGMPTTDDEVVFESGAGIGHYTHKGYVAIGLDAADNAYDYLNNADAVSEIKVLDTYGKEVDGVVELDGDRTYLPAYVYPLTAKAELEFAENEYFDYNTQTGHLVQKKPASGNVDVTFTAGGVSKTVTVKAMQDLGIKHNWQLNDVAEGEDVNSWRSTNSGVDNFLYSYYTTYNPADGVLQNENGLMLKKPVLLKADGEWSVRIMGKQKFWYAWNAVILNLTTKTGHTGIITEGSSEIYLKLDSYKHAQLNDMPWTTISEYNSIEVPSGEDEKKYKFNTLVADEMKLIEIKNVKQDDGTYLMYFCMDGNEYPFTYATTEDLYLTGISKERCFEYIDYIEVATNYDDTQEPTDVVTFDNKVMTLTSTNKTSKTSDSRAIIGAVYSEDGALKEIKSFDEGTIEFLSSSTQTLEFTKYSEGDTVKYFTWDSLGSMKSIKGVQKLK